jgi:phosphatidylserine/phosphatidylglycerophosphate/cardiolipin synthase-like enzyme
MRLILVLLVFQQWLAGCVTQDPGDTDGDGKADGDGDATSCASPMFNHIYDAIHAEHNPDVPFDLIRSTYNRLDPTPMFNGNEIYAKTEDLIASAKSEVTFETWNWGANSGPTERIIQGLVRLNDRRIAEAASGPPVVVYLLLNYAPPYGSQYMSDAWKQVDAAKLDPRHVRVVLASYEHQLLGANHAKSLTVDGKIALVNGANASSDNYGDNLYYDGGFLVEGDAALAVRGAFGRLWMDSQSEEWICGADWGKAYDNDPATLCERKNTPLPQLRRPDLSVSRDEVCSPVIVATREASGVPFPSHSSHKDPLAQAFLTAVALATEEVQIQTPNLNEPIMMDALIATARSGIRVNVVLSKNYEDFNESLLGRGGTNADSVDYIYQQLANFPDACDRFRVRWFSLDGVNPITENGPPTSHLKYMAVDGEVVFVGSSNHDVQSWHNSRELAMVVDDPATVKAWQTMFTFDTAVDNKYCAGR